MPLSPRPPHAPARLPVLDGIRGLAILLVVTHNLNLLTGPQSLSSHLVATVLERGWIGVQLFFVLSGSLITGILIDSHDDPHPYARFFASRTLRILPLYYGTLLVVFGLLPLLNLGTHASAATIVSLSLFVSNWVQPFLPGDSPLPHFWSLAVEEQFYLLWPFAIRRLDPRGIVRLCAGVAVVALLARAWMIWNGDSHNAVYEYSICRMDALAAGAAAAALLRWPGCREWLVARPQQLVAGGLAVLLAGALVCHGYTQFNVNTQTVGYLALSLGFAAVVLGLACADLAPEPQRWAEPLRAAWLRRVGLYSYAMYVLHAPLHGLLGTPWMKSHGWGDPSALGSSLAYIAIGTLVTFAAGALSYHQFEVHFLRLKPRLTRLLSSRPAGSGKAALSSNGQP